MTSKDPSIIYVGASGFTMEVKGVTSTLCKDAIKCDSMCTQTLNEWQDARIWERIWDRMQAKAKSSCDPWHYYRICKRGGRHWWMKRNACRNWKRINKKARKTALNPQGLSTYQRIRQCR